MQMSPSSTKIMHTWAEVGEKQCCSGILPSLSPENVFKLEFPNVRNLKGMKTASP